MTTTTTVELTPDLPTTEMPHGHRVHPASPGTPTPHTPATTKLDKAWTTIGEVVGEKVVAALRTEGVLGNHRDVLKLAALPDAQMRSVANLVAAGWPLKEALKYRDHGDDQGGRLTFGHEPLNALVKHVVASGKNEFEGVFYRDEFSGGVEWIVSIRPKNPAPETK